MNVSNRYFFVGYVHNIPGFHHYENFYLTTSNGLHPTMKELTNHAESLRIQF